MTLIGDHFDINDVTEELRTKPSWIKRRDEKLNASGHLFGHDEWGVNTGWYDLDDETNTFESVLQNLLNLLPPDAPLLKSLAQKHHAEWHILFDIDVYEGFPSMIIDNTFIAFVGEMGGRIGFDINNYQESI